jgi:sphinganine-1-phosphate aldolase
MPAVYSPCHATPSPAPQIKLHVLPLGADGRLSAAAVRRRMNGNTAVVVASAPGFPHGLVDDVEVCACTRARVVCVCVCACLCIRP